MFNITRKEIEWGGKTLVLETGKVARQADGAVLVTYGATCVMCTVVSEKKPKEGISFMPLTVHYREMAFAAGKIPGGFFKREGRPSEKEVLTSRLIDRPLRPLFNEHFYHETQVICTVLSHDLVNDPDIVALVAASAALAISGIPFNGPLAAARVALVDGKFIVNPTAEEMMTTELDLVVSGTKDSILMVESEAKQLSEEQMLEAVMFGHEQFQPVIKLIEEFAKDAAKPTWEIPTKLESPLAGLVDNLARSGLLDAYKETVKSNRYSKISAVEKETVTKLLEEGYLATEISAEFKKVQQDIVRSNIVNSNIRIDGRDNKTIRPIVAEVDMLPKTHGSALFTRGETQALVVTTLGTSQDEQIIDALEGDGRTHFMLHYNFLPYSVGEASQLKAPGRREIGHGKLAWRAIRGLLPEKADFPYTIRIVSEITESNGSSSMATVCGASLSLMDAGVPLAKPVAGIAMGLIKEGDKFVVLSDILGDEDNLGDMDFKVAGTKDGITALQMDIKIPGITKEIMQVSLQQAGVGRLHILSKMEAAITEHRTTVNTNAPAITSFSINKDKIREVIGSGGSVIKKICELSGAKVDIEDDGTVRVAAVNANSAEIAVKMIQDIVLEPEIGQIYDGTVVKVVEFGAFVNFLGSRDGLVHISELSDQRIADVREIVDEGHKVKVLVVGIDNRGKVKLSIRLVNQETGEADIEGLEEYRKQDDNSGGGSRGGSRGGGRPPRSGGNRDSRGGERSSDRDRPRERDSQPRESDRVEKRKYFS